MSCTCGRRWWFWLEVRVKSVAHASQKSQSISVEGGKAPILYLVLRPVILLLLRDEIIRFS